MKSKWLVWWRDGSVTVWDAARWTATQILSMANVIDAALCSAETAAEVADWWQSDSLGNVESAAMARAIATATEPANWDATTGRTLAPIPVPQWLLTLDRECRGVAS